MLLKPTFWACCALAVLALMSLDLLTGYRVLPGILEQYGLVSESGGISNASSTADSKQAVFRLPRALRSESASAFRTAAKPATLEVTNRADQSIGTVENPAGETQPTFVRNVPMLTPSQFEQVFDTAPELKKELDRIGPAVPIGYFPGMEISGQADSSNRAEADTRNVATHQPEEPIATPVTTDASTMNQQPPTDSTSELVAPLVPLNQLDWASSHLDQLSNTDASEFHSDQVAEGQLSPSFDITPMEANAKSKAEAGQKVPPPIARDEATNPLRPKIVDRPELEQIETNFSNDSLDKPTVATKEPFADTKPSAWPRPEFLLTRVHAASRFPGLDRWSLKTSGVLEAFARLQSLDDPAAYGYLADLQSLADQLEPFVVSFSTAPTTNADEALGTTSVELRRLNYLVRQHVDIWSAAHNLASSHFQSLADYDSETIVRFASASRRRLSLPGISQEWSDYLLFQQLETAFDTLQPDRKRQQSASRRFLARLSSPILDQTQRKFLSENIEPELVEQLKVSACEPICLPELLAEIEQAQYNRNSVSLHRINQQFQNLVWHNDPATQPLAEAIDNHFRNANFRISVSDELLNQLLPQQPDSHLPVNENIMGAQVNGQSRIANRLQLRLIPDSSRIQMRLEAIGRVFSHTEAQRSGFTVQNVGDARFQVFKRLLIGRDGIVSERPQASSKASNKMVGMKSNLDGVPIFGWVARRIAERKIAEQTPQVQNYTENKLEHEVRNRFESEIENQLAEMQEYLYANMIQPLTALELEPTPLEMRSTDQRVIMRYRLAGFDQMAGNTSRPRGLQDSLLSMQIHESAINNLLNRVDLNGREFSAEELAQHLADVFGMQPQPNSQSANAVFEFAPFDPIRIKFAEGIAAVQLNLKKLRIGEGKSWRNLTVSCKFVPQVAGNQIVFAQDGAGVTLTGHKLSARDQVAVRTIFTALFKDQYAFPVLPRNIAAKLGPSLTISQMEVADGWIGLSVDNSENLLPIRASGLEPAWK